MRKISIISSVIILLLTSTNGYAFDLSSLFGGSKENGSTVGSAISNILTDLTSTSEFDINNLVGTWNYSSPAVNFKSNDVLTNVGGSAASGVVESKLESYYQIAGINTLTFTVDSNLKFSMATKIVTLNGTIEKGENGTLIFNFNAFDKIKIGKITAYAEKSANNLSLTFDVSKIITIAEKISSIANNDTFKSAVAILKNYDGIYVGFNVTKQR